MLASILKEKLQKSHLPKFELIYPQNTFTYQQERYQKALDAFISLYGDTDVEIYSSSGRSEIGGNHTDHQGGKVLCAAINLDGIAIVHFHEDKIIRLTSENTSYTIDIHDLERNPAEDQTTTALVRGMLHAFEMRNMKYQGADIYVTSDVLVGSGMSSSAMFELLIGVIMNEHCNNNAIDAVELAKMAQYAENVYFNKPCGLMDQMAISVGGFCTIDFKDSNNIQIKKIDYDFEKSGYAFCIIDTLSSHDDLTSDYAAIPQEMKEVAKYFDKKILSEVNEENFYQALPNLKQMNTRSLLRAMHYFNENHVVDKEVQALQANDFDTFLQGITASGNSSFKYLQNIYSLSSPFTQGVSFALALSEHFLQGKGACRVHGGGFAGTIEAFVPKDALTMYKENMERVLGKDSVHVLSIRPIGPIKVTE